jgi:hypothetical protein
MIDAMRILLVPLALVADDFALPRARRDPMTAEPEIERC